MSGLNQGRKTRFFANLAESCLKCDLCDARYWIQSKLDKHYATHVQPELVCKVCGASFQNSEYMSQHLLLHVPQNATGHQRKEDPATEREKKAPPKSAVLQRPPTEALVRKRKIQWGSITVKGDEKCPPPRKRVAANRKMTKTPPPPQVDPERRIQITAPSRIREPKICNVDSSHRIEEAMLRQASVVLKRLPEKVVQACGPHGSIPLKNLVSKDRPVVPKGARVVPVSGDFMQKLREGVRLIIPPQVLEKMRDPMQSSKAPISSALPSKSPTVLLSGSNADLAREVTRLVIQSKSPVDGTGPLSVQPSGTEVVPPRVVNVVPPVKTAVSPSVLHSRSILKVTGPVLPSVKTAISPTVPHSKSLPKITEAALPAVKVTSPVCPDRTMVIEVVPPGTDPSASKVMRRGGRSRVTGPVPVVVYGVEDMRRDAERRREHRERMEHKERLLKKMLAKYAEKERKKDTKLRVKKVARVLERHSQRLADLQQGLSCGAHWEDSRLLRELKMLSCGEPALEIAELFRCAGLEVLEQKMGVAESYVSETRPTPPTPPTPNTQDRLPSVYRSPPSVNGALSNSTIKYSSRKPQMRIRLPRGPRSKEKGARSKEKGPTHYQEDPFTDLSMITGEKYVLQCPCNMPFCNSLHDE